MSEQTDVSNVLNIYQRILNIMADVDYIQKGDKKVNGQFTFVSHDLVSAVMHKQFVKHRVVAIPTVAGQKQEGNRTEVRLDTTFINVDDPADRFTVSMGGQGIDPGDKGIGKAVSYAWKYTLLKVFCLETGDDPDNDATASYDGGWSKKEDPVSDIAISLYSKKPDNISLSISDMGKYVAYLATKHSTEQEKILKKGLDNPVKFFETCSTWLKG